MTSYISALQVPFHRAGIGDAEINEVVAALRSGWLTTGPRTKQFESEFSQYVGTRHAVALNSATAALHLALEAIGVTRGDSVLVPTMTFAATAEVVRYFDAKPILVDCDEHDFNISPSALRREAKAAIDRGERVKAVIPVHYGGQAVDMKAVLEVAREYGLKVIEDAAHCCPASYRDSTNGAWKKVGSESDICCYSFYANKCITTGEGGMACTDNEELADRMRIMALHGISKDAWKRFTADGSWYYEIIAPGFKYNLTDIASAIGIHQLRKADAFRREREHVANRYNALLAGEELILPKQAECRLHSWHLYVVRLKLEHLKIDRAATIAALKKLGIGASVHWIPLHMHPYYRETYGYKSEDYPVAAKLSGEIISLPIFPSMSEDQIEYVASGLRTILAENRR